MKKITLKTKLLGAFLGAGLIPVFSIGIYSYYNSSNTLKHEVVAKLDAIRALKANAIKRYFELSKEQVISFSNNQGVKQALVNFTKGFHEFNKDNDFSSIDVAAKKAKLREYYVNEYGKEYAKQNSKPVDTTTMLNLLSPEEITLQTAYIADNSNPLGSKHLLESAYGRGIYNTTHAHYHANFREYLDRFGYYDIFLIDGKTGHIVYSVYKELDFATSLLTGPYKDTGLGKVFRSAWASTDENAIFMEDYDFYRPSYDGPAGFIAVPVWINGERVGVVAFQVNFDRINNVMMEKSGNETTLQTFLVGSDFKLRSDVPLDREHFNVRSSFTSGEKGLIKTDAVDAALKGDTGYFISPDLKGNESVKSYSSVDILGHRWAVVSVFNTEEAFAPINKLRNVFFVFIFVVASLVSFFAVWFARNLANSLLRVTEGLRKEANTVGDTAEIVAEVSGKLSEATTEQAASLQQTVASIDEISAMIARNADSASGSARTSEQSTLAAQKGKDKVELMMESINSIANGNNEIIEQMQKSNKEISEIVKVIQEISQKTQVINDIVFQTKLLSFNASVEAARAGEHGKGFAVVAEEVGNLASMSGKAATEITDMLSKSVKRVTDIVDGTKGLMDNLIRQSKEKVDFGTNTARDCAQALDEILNNVSSVNEMVREISTASQEQSAGVREVNKAMSELDQVTQSNSSASQESSRTSMELKSQAERLNSLVDELTTLVEGHVPEVRGQKKRPAEVVNHNTQSNIVSFKQKKAAQKAESKEVKRAVGVEFNTPDSNDSRFEDT